MRNNRSKPKRRSKKNKSRKYLRLKFHNNKSNKSNRCNKFNKCNNKFKIITTVTLYRVIVIHVLWRIGKT